MININCYNVNVSFYLNRFDKPGNIFIDFFTNLKKEGMVVIDVR